MYIPIPRVGFERHDAGGLPMRFLYQVAYNVRKTDATKTRSQKTKLQQARILLYYPPHFITPPKNIQESFS